MGCGLWARDRRRRHVVCGWEQRPLSLLSLSDSLSSLFSLLYCSHSDSISQNGFWFWFDLERDLSDSLKASQCRVKHNLLWRIKEKENLWRIKEKEMVATVAFKVVAVETNGREKEKVRMREKEEKMKK